MISCDLALFQLKMIFPQALIEVVLCFAGQLSTRGSRYYRQWLMLSGLEQKLTVYTVTPAAAPGPFLLDN